MPSDSSPSVPNSTSGAPTSAGFAVATLVSYGVNPLILPPLVYGLVLAHIGAPLHDVVLAASLGAFFLGLIPLVHVSLMRLRGRVESLEIRDRKQRTEPFLVAIGATLAALVVAASVPLVGRLLLILLLGCHLLNSSLLLGITRWWKISVHCASVAGAVATVGFVQYHLPGSLPQTSVLGGLTLGLGGVLILLVLWARVRTGAHSMGQATAGTVLGLVAPYAELYAGLKVFGF